jgi:hypothetical protein
LSESFLAMQNAKRYILVDERSYDDLWKRSITDTSKEKLNQKLHFDLDCDTLPDDLKAKRYQETLNRFLNLKQEVPVVESTLLNGSTAPPKKLPKRKSIQWEVLDKPSRRSQRNPKKKRINES